MRDVKTMCGRGMRSKLKGSSISKPVKSSGLVALLSCFVILIVLLVQACVVWVLETLDVQGDPIIAYSGGVVIGIIALFTLMINLVNNEKAQKTRYMPFILMDFGNQDTSDDLFYPDGVFHVTFENDTAASNLLPETTSWQVICGQLTRRLKNHSGWAISLKNIGNGVAHSISLKVNNAEIFSSRVLEKGQTLSGYCYVPKNMASIDLHVVLTFQDMMNNKYVQEHSYHKNSGGSPTISLGKPLT